MTNGNEPAFGKAAFYHPDGVASSPQQGLSKREYFAAMAMQGMLSNPHSHTLHIIAANAVDMADVLIKALNKQDNETMVR